MSLFVNTNVSSLNAQRQLFTTGNNLSTAFERLSSGFRINSAADDAAGLQITDRMTSQVQGLNQAVRNANDGISLAQTAEGAMQETTTALQRIRTLAIQSQNGINSSADRVALQKEVSALRTEISRISTTTQFAGVNILSGDFSAKFLVGANAGQTISVNLSTAALARAGVNGFSATGLGILADNVLTEQGASRLLTAVDSAISAVGGLRADLGALQNRFQSTIRNLSNISENVSAARSRIKDADFATETAELSRNQILQQASTTILAQANQRPQAALSLLG
ncbi:MULTISPECIES: flagellin N-terminal helical domain-containing protein [Alteromonas]|jgi:flagellin|uniref:Flagellin n=1 Tax=Alteromonas macleodii TaxID=28108 RepID=A0A1E7DI68_ALTMA|nr:MULTISPECIES: flagellin [Alteromonas]AFT94464.1 flagellin-like protein [Alteromonas macleodii str. 'Balearic Sea AD45']NOH59954.1 flagellin FliC [Alteromonas sp. 07-89-2]OES34322.1 bacterial flagellin C-terminal helical region family protein [Alteromonas macleodii]OES35748.1 bacterial flagellin C-terminal helical region family protein [Alteromonas macleodii]OES36057.1 bacterial flagellin C-terminal helical region family protein [Alteromonas macleodii]|tara:strand:+ start:1583 stop:2428 length:846 start_codon:yes stop_codon:yes gene_type:complete